MTDFAFERAPIDICPACETPTLGNLYSIRDVFSGEKIYYCNTCHTKLVYTSNGWVKKDE